MSDFSEETTAIISGVRVYIDWSNLITLGIHTDTAKMPFEVINSNKTINSRGDARNPRSLYTLYLNSELTHVGSYRK